MKVEPTGGSPRVFMNPQEYQTMLESYPERRTKIAMQLMGETGVRGCTVVDIVPIDIHQSPESDVDLWFIDVDGKDSSPNTDSKLKPRDVWLPYSLKCRLDEWIEEQNIRDHQTLIDVEKDMVRKNVKEAGENAARKTGNEWFEDVTPHDFRRYWATRLLVRRGVDQDIVQELGGWRYRKSMEPYIQAKFDDYIRDGLARAGLVETGPKADQGPRSSELEQLKQQVAHLTEAVEQLNPQLSIDPPVPQRALSDYCGD